MKCSRVQLSDRTVLKSQRSEKTTKDAPRHYCQRRLADSSYDEKEFLKRYTPERFHLTISDSNESEGDTRPLTPATMSETPEIFDIKIPKNVFRPAFLTVTNIDLPASVKTSTNSTTWLKRKAKYKTVPKNCSAHMHRMFVKNIEERSASRAPSRASTDFERSAFEEYLCQLVLPDDSSEMSLFYTDSQTRYAEQEYDVEEAFNNNNDSYFINKNNSTKSHSTTKRCATAASKKTKSVISNVNSTKVSTITEKCVNANNSKSVKSEVSGNYKREKRKSITLSRVPSPETIQVIRIDVITGYPVDNDSVLTELTDEVVSCEEASQLNTLSDCNEFNNSEEKGSKNNGHTWKTSPVDGKISNIEKNDTKIIFSPLCCKSLNLSARF